MQRVLLTGAAGFLGSHMLGRLRLTDADLHAVSRAARPSDGRVAWHAADLRDPAAAGRLVRSLRPTHVLHAAWGVRGDYWESPENAAWADGSIALVRASAETGARFVGAGTCAEYDWSASHFVEGTTPVRPATAYGRAKADVWASADVPESGPAAWGRIFHAYGPGDSAGRLFPTVAASLRRGEPIALTIGTQERDFVHAADIAEFFVRLLEGECRGAFNVGTGVGTSVRAALEMLADSLAADRALLRFGAKPWRRNDCTRLVADTRRAEALLGYVPTTMLSAPRLLEAVGQTVPGVGAE
jgi:nucleoside-diphosphate-sugar epimerase